MYKSWFSVLVITIVTTDLDIQYFVDCLSCRRSAYFEYE